MYQIRAEQIEFVIQSDKLIHQLVLYLAVHQFIVPTIAVTRLGACNVVERLQLASPMCAIALGLCQLLFASASGLHRETTTSSGYHLGSMHATPQKLYDPDFGNRVTYPVSIRSSRNPPSSMSAGMSRVTWQPSKAH
jgi:hypothetical protein